MSEISIISMDLYEFRSYKHKIQFKIQLEFWILYILSQRNCNRCKYHTYICCDVLMTFIFAHDKWLIHNYCNKQNTINVFCWNNYVVHRYKEAWASENINHIFNNLRMFLVSPYTLDCNFISKIICFPADT